MGSIRKSREERAGSQRTSAIYLIRNGTVEPDAEFFARRTGSRVALQSAGK
jgi:hypothetical protein